MIRLYPDKIVCITSCISFLGIFEDYVLGLTKEVFPEIKYGSENDNYKCMLVTDRSC